MSKGQGKCKFNADTITVFLNSIKKGNFRDTASKEAGINPKLIYMWFKNPKPEYQEFKRKVIEAEAMVESRCVNNLVHSKDEKWQAWYLERKFKHWNIAVHRWEFQVLQRQIKQLKGIIDELLEINQAGRTIDTDSLLPQNNPYAETLPPIRNN